MVARHTLHSSAAGKNRFMPVFVVSQFYSNISIRMKITNGNYMIFTIFGIFRSCFIFNFCVFKWKLGAPTRLCAGALYACIIDSQISIWIFFSLLLLQNHNTLAHIRFLANSTRKFASDLHALHNLLRADCRSISTSWVFWPNNAIWYRLKIQTKIMQFIYMPFLWRAFVVRFPQTINWHSTLFESFDYDVFFFARSNTRLRSAAVTRVTVNGSE